MENLGLATQEPAADDADALATHLTADGTLDSGGDERVRGGERAELAADPNSGRERFVQKVSELSEALPSLVTSVADEPVAVPTLTVRNSE